MEDLLLEPVCDAELFAPAPQLIAQLRQEVAELRADVAGLRRENLELRQQAGYWKGMHAQACRRIAELETEVEHLHGENRKLQAQAFGRKSEKQSRSDRSNQLEDPNEPRPQRPRGQQRGRPGHSRRDYSHLPVREAISELTEAERVCPHCGLPSLASGVEDAEQLESEIVVYRRVTHRRLYQLT